MTCTRSYSFGAKFLFLKCVRVVSAMKENRLYTLHRSHKKFLQSTHGKLLKYCLGHSLEHSYE